MISGLWCLAEQSGGLQPPDSTSRWQGEAGKPEPASRPSFPGVCFGILIPSVFSGTLIPRCFLWDSLSQCLLCNQQLLFCPSHCLTPGFWRCRMGTAHPTAGGTLRAFSLCPGDVLGSSLPAGHREAQPVHPMIPDRRTARWESAASVFPATAGQGAREATLHHSKQLLGILSFKTKTRAYK